MCMTNTLIKFMVDEKMKKIPFSINDDEVLEDEIRKTKAHAIEELDSIHLNISNDIDEKDEIYNAIMEKYERIN